MVFHWRLSDSKSPHVSRTLLCMLTNFSSALIWIVSTPLFQVLFQVLKLWLASLSLSCLTDFSCYQARFRYFFSSGKSVKSIWCQVWVFFCSLIKTRFGSLVLMIQDFRFGWSRIFGLGDPGFLDLVIQDFFISYLICYLVWLVFEIGNFLVAQ